MSPRISRFLPCLVVLFLNSGISQAQEPVKTPSHPMIHLYRTIISPIDGDRCPMYPSCSTYALEALKKHGPIVGWIMTCDRLLRCGGDEKNSAPLVRVSGRLLTHDPVSANDFWWRKPKE